MRSLRLAAVPCTVALGCAAALLCALAGCASASPEDSTVERRVPVTAENLPEVQRAGYSVVNRDGEKLYCRRERLTGSHARFETHCLTAQELDALKDATQRGVDGMRRQRPPPQEHR